MQVIISETPIEDLESFSIVTIQTVKPSSLMQLVNSYVHENEEEKNINFCLVLNILLAKKQQMTARQQLEKHIMNRAAASPKGSNLQLASGQSVGGWE